MAVKGWWMRWRFYIMFHNKNGGACAKAPVDLIIQRDERMPSDNNNEDGEL